LFRNFKLGVNTYGEAHHFIIKHKLWGYVLLPGIISIVLLLLVIFFGWNLASRITDYAFDYFGLNDEPEGFLKYLIVGFYYILKFGLRVIFVLLYIMFYKYMVLVLISPFLALLSEKTEKLIYGTQYPFSFKQYIKDIFRGNIIVLRNVIVELLWFIVFFFFSYLPIIGLIGPVILFIIACYFFGFFMIDYCSERHKMTIRESVHFVRINKGFAIANGIIFYLLLMIPVLGIMVAPSYSVVAATIGTERIRNNETTMEKINT
jgi:CysZ protein